MTPDGYLRSDMWEMFNNNFPEIDNIEEYTCEHLWWADCGTCKPVIYFCEWCWKKNDGKST